MSGSVDITAANNTPPHLSTEQPPVTSSPTPNPSDLLLITSSPLEQYNPHQLVSTPSAGATSVFLGTTRHSFHDKRVLHLSYECYTAMATEQLQQLAAEMRSMWQLQRVAIVHRTGLVGIGEASVLIAASSAHRREALDAVSWCIDELKRRVVVWKKVRTSHVAMDEQLAVPLTFTISLVSMSSHTDACWCVWLLLLRRRRTRTAACGRRTASSTCPRSSSRPQT